MSDTYDDDKPTQTLPPPPPWFEGAHEIWIEPIAHDYSVVAVHAQRTINGPVGTVLMESPPAINIGVAQCWMADQLALARAVTRAIAECDGQTKEGKAVV